MRNRTVVSAATNCMNVSLLAVKPSWANQNIIYEVSRTSFITHNGEAAYADAGAIADYEARLAAEMFLDPSVIV